MSDRDLPARVEIYDTTLRDGSQLEGISLTVDDKLRIAEQLDWLDAGVVGRLDEILALDCEEALLLPLPA